MGRSVVIGAGISGRAAAQFLLARGKKVTVVDRNPQQLTFFESSDRLHIALEEEFTDWQDVDEVILSSGIRPCHPLAQGKTVIGEAELALRTCGQRCVGITGTNGKTTVTLLVVHVLNCVGIPARALGNIGSPLTEYFLKPKSEEVLVVELSSYQLETLHARVFDGGVILNITPDHLDRYDSFEAYAAAKCRLERCLKPGAPLFIHAEGEAVFGHLLQEKKMISCVEQGFKNRHDHENNSAAWELVKLFGVTWEQFLAGVESFQKPPHRIEFVGKWRGVSYFNDSKGTNLDAVIRAVESMEGRVLLIAGGVDKGASYEAWMAPFAKKVKKIFTLGEAAAKMEKELTSHFEMAPCASLEEAVRRASSEASEGESVLLSPGCASFDMFRDYVHRGEEFKRCVIKLLA